MTSATGSPIVIDSENKISVSVDGVTVKVDDTGKKLKGNYTATAPITLSAGSTTTQPSFTLGYDSNTL